MPIWLHFSKSNKIKIRWVPVAFGLLVTVLLLGASIGATVKAAPAAAGGSSAPLLSAVSAHPPSCYWQTGTFSGLVKDMGGYGLPGVVVYIIGHRQAVPPCQDALSAVTDGTGHWRVTGKVNQFNSVSLYWQSASNGPYLSNPGNIQPGTSYTWQVHVWRADINENLLDEFPNDPNGHTQISFTTSTSIQVSVNAKLSGNVQAGFLGVDVAGSVGTTITMQQQVTESFSSPYEVYKVLGEIIRVQDANGNYIVYAVPYSSSLFQTAGITDYLTMNEGINRDSMAGIYPYLQVAPSGSSTFTYTFSQEVNMDLSVGITIGGSFLGLSASVTLTIDFSTTSGTSQSVALQVTNPTTGNACYVVFQEGMEIHAWFYGNGNCPP